MPSATAAACCEQIKEMAPRRRSRQSRSTLPGATSQRIRPQVAAYPLSCASKAAALSTSKAAAASALAGPRVQRAGAAMILIARLLRCTAWSGTTSGSRPWSMSHSATPPPLPAASSARRLARCSRLASTSSHRAWERATSPMRRTSSTRSRRCPRSTTHRSRRSRPSSASEGPPRRRSLTHAL